MATNPVNLVDAIGTVVPRLARNRSAVLRTGVVLSVANEWCGVRISAPVPVPPAQEIVTNAGYHTFYRPRVGDVVSVLNDGDRWLVVGCLAAADNQVAEPYVQFGETLMTVPNSTNVSLLMTLPKVYAGKPTVVGNINSASGSMISYTIKAWGVSATSFTLGLYSASAVVANYTAAIQWMAAGYMASVDLTRGGLEMPEPGFHYATLTCHTAGCLKDGEPVPYAIAPDDPEPGWMAKCGACRQQILDIV